MSWLRLDDKFGRHEKVLALNDREFRVHVLALLYCAEYSTRGRVPDSAWRSLGATPKIVAKLARVGLWDVNGIGHVIHDFTTYNPVDQTSAERKRRYRERHQGTDEEQQGNGDGTETERSEERSSRVGARARPVPTPTQPHKPELPSVSESPPSSPIARPPADDDVGRLFEKGKREEAHAPGATP